MTEQSRPLDRSPFFAIALDLQCVVDQSGCLRDVNPAWERTLGRTTDDLIGRPLSDVVPAEDLPGLRAHLDAIRTGEGVGWFECRVRAGDGSHRWTRWSPQGRVVGGLIFAVATDVTEERLRAESERENQASFGLLSQAVERQLITLREQAELLEAATEAILVRDVEGHILYWNRGAEELYGWSRSEALGRVTHSLLATRFPQPFESIWTQLAERGSWKGEVVHRRRDGRALVVASRWVIRREADRSDPSILEINTDITDRKAAEEALQESEARFRAVFEAAGLGIGLEDGHRRLVEANPALTELLGREAASLVGRRLSEFVVDDDHAADHDPFAELLDGTRSTYRVDRRFARPDGTILPTRETVSVVRDDAGRLRFVLTMVEDLRLALIDELTGLNNRRAFLAFGEQQLRLARRERRHATVLFVDFDGLKAINDTLGHLEGDRALVEVAGLLVGTLRSADFVARFGGDEFCALLLHEDGGHASAVDRLEREVAAANAQPGRRFSVSISIGAARFDWRAPVSIEELIGQADRAMYRAKDEPAR